MGQKTHPHGLRVGIHRKWNSSWYGVETEGKNLYFYQKSVEEFFKVWMSWQAYTKIAKIKRVLLVDVKMFKQSMHQFFIFIFFYKLRTKRRRQVKKKIYKHKFHLKQDFETVKNNKYKKWTNILIK